MLQGPHGPFFSQLAGQLDHAGCKVTRVLFNAGDRVFWRADDADVRFTGQIGSWSDYLENLIEARSITDVVLYGAPRPVHKAAASAAASLGLTVHFFEEGYLRPYWITYEREGTNGHSRLMSLSMADITETLGEDAAEIPEAPATWGEMRHHVFYGALYHAAVLVGARRFPNYRSHRGVPVAYELKLYLKRLFSMPAHYARRAVSKRLLERGGFPYHLVLLQLAHDSSFMTHSDLPGMESFVEIVTSNFAKGAPPHHHLVFKAHPLEDDRAQLRRMIMDCARSHRMTKRVHFMVGGKLAPLLDEAESAVTVNSTAAQQALWRGLPVKCFGRAVYDKPELVSDQPLHMFFAAPQAPDLAAYRHYRQFLLLTSQIRGGFYSRKGRQTLLRRIVDIMLDPRSPYEKLANRGETKPQQIRLIR